MKGYLVCLKDEKEKYLEYVASDYNRYWTNKINDAYIYLNQPHLKFDEKCVEVKVKLTVIKKKNEKEER